MKKTKRMLILVIVLMMMITGCQNGKANDNNQEVASNEGKAYKDTFTVALSAEPPNLDPTGNSTVIAKAVQWQIFETLVDKDENGNIIPTLATKWEIIDDLTVRFYLRDDVFFHNGEKMTAEDVKFSFERGAVSSTAAYFFKSFDTENAVVVEDYIIDIKLKEPFAPFLNYLSTSRGQIVSKKAVEEMGDDQFARNPVGTGPFKFSKWTTGTDIELVKFDNYYGEKPDYTNLIIKFISEPANRAIELETGGVDMVYNIDPSDANRFKEDPNYKIITGPSYKYQFITMNMQDETLKNKKLREALTYALDIDSIVDAVFGDYAVRANGIMSNTMWGFKEMEPTPYDPDLAKKLLAEAGYPDGLDLSFKMSANSQIENIAEIAQNMWKQVGINASIEMVDRASFKTKEVIDSLQLSIRSVSSNTADPAHTLIIWHNSYNKGKLQANDPYINETLNEGSKIYDEVLRREHYNVLQDYLYDLHYEIPISFDKIIYATGSNVEGLECDPGGVPKLSKVKVYEK